MKLFISYRREDNPYAAGQINDQLVHRYGKDTVFFDIESIPLGEDFRSYINSVISKCDAALIVIGDNWLEKDENGVSRLDDPEDIVRIEIAVALERGIPVVPVLVGNAEVPKADELPDAISKLSYRTATELRSGADFTGHMQRLTRMLDEKLPLSPAASAAGRTPSRMPVILLILLIVVSGIAGRAYWVYNPPGSSLRLTASSVEYYAYLDAIQSGQVNDAELFLRSYPDSPLAPLVKIQVNNDKQALAEAKNKANQGDAVGLLTIAELTRLGTEPTIEKSTASALDYARAAAELDHPIAHYLLADLLLSQPGDVADEDRIEAVASYNAAIAADFSVAETDYGVRLWMNGTNEQRTQGIDLLESASAKGDRVAKFFLAQILLQQDTERARDDAIALLKESSRLGNQRAADLLEQILQDDD